MRYAIISVSEQGAKLGALIAANLDAEIDLYERKERASGEDAIYFNRTLALTDSIFHDYDALIYIMAIGIVVRAIAPHIRDKTHDPAVVVLDERGIHVISLLAGHLGGANELASEIAYKIGADPVITTATDVNGYPAPDVLARHIGAKVEPVAALKPVNSAVARGEKVEYFLDERMLLADAIRERAKQDGINCRKLSEVEKEKFAAAVIISDRNDIVVDRTHVFLRPPTLTVGMGCRRGTPKEVLMTALENACNEIGRSSLSVACLTSAWVKRDEAGLLELATDLRRNIYFYEAEEMNETVEKYNLEESKFVKKTIGVGNVCETTAILKTGSNRLIMNKTKYPRATIAIAEAVSLSSAWDRGMRRK